MFLEMWLWIITVLNIIINVHAFSSGGFPQSCESLEPQHGPFSPQDDTAPYNISFTGGNDGDPYTVFLRSTGSDSFSGFMLVAQKEDGSLLGRFTRLNPVTLLDCNGSVASAASQVNNQPKKLYQVKWTPGEELKGNINFKATFVKSFTTFWTNVTMPISTETSTTTVPSTTQPITTQGSTQAKTTLDPTEPSTKSIKTTTPHSSTTPPPPSPPPPPPPYYWEKVVTALMVADSAQLVMKTELSNILTNTISKSHVSRPLDKILKLSCLVLCGAIEIAVLGVTIVCGPSHVTLIALVCVVIVMTVLELSIVSLPLGPSHELKQICDLGAKVCTFIHEGFTIAFIYIGYLDITDRNRRKSKLLWVMIAYTAWILLFVVWMFVMATQKHVILRRRKKVSSMKTGHRGGEKKTWLPAAVPVIPIIFIVGTCAFAVTLIVGILRLPETSV